MKMFVIVVVVFVFLLLFCMVRRADVDLHGSFCARTALRTHTYVGVCVCICVPEPMLVYDGGRLCLLVRVGVW